MIRPLRAPLDIFSPPDAFVWSGLNERFARRLHRRNNHGDMEGAKQVDESGHHG
jgi:hypothetical protein